MSTPRTRRRVRRNPHRSEVVPLAATLGARVRLLRKEEGFTFDAFVEETMLGRGYISELERGLVVPSLTTLGRLAEALELSMPELVAFGDSLVDQLADAARGLSVPQRKYLLKEALRLAKGKARA
jgi:transcriptional regulator with XRE-family HTH domain